MAEQGHSNAHQQPHSAPMSPTVLLLERLDNVAHVIVAAFFILMAATVIIHIGFVMARQVPLTSQLSPLLPTTETTTPNAEVHAPAHKADAAAKPSLTTPEGKMTKATSTEGNKPESSAAATNSASTSSGKDTAVVEEKKDPPDLFVKNSLILLSDILFVVILLELLRTIITYLQTHDIQAIMQEFLVVGIISSVRKILLVGAEASLNGSKGMEFIQEATGVVIDIFGILLLIGCLIVLKRSFGEKEHPHPAES